MSLDAKQAVRLAKEWLKDQFSDEPVENLGLEEVRLNDGAWEITLGFSRPWDGLNSVMASLSERLTRRTYKVVVVDDQTEHVVEMRNREAA